MENNVKISIVVAVYNAEKSIERCIKSLISQTYDDIEIILVDDGSKDKSLEICKKYKKIDNRISIISKRNNGVSSARNIGIKNSSGKYIQFVDSDDYIDSRMCEKLVCEIEKNKSDFVICGYNDVDDSENINKYITYSDKTFRTLKDMNGHFEKLYSKNLVNTIWNKLYIKDLITDNFDEKISLGEDLLFNLKYMKNIKNGISVISECLYYYVNFNKGSLSSNFRRDRIEIGEKLQKNVHSFCKENLGSNYDKESIDIPFAYLIQETINLCVNDQSITNKYKRRIISDIIYDNYVQNICKNVRLYNLHSNISNFLIRNRFIHTIYIFHKLKMKFKNKNFNMNTNR